MKLFVVHVLSKFVFLHAVDGGGSKLVIDGMMSSRIHCYVTLPILLVTKGFALPAATASSSLRFTTPLLATEHCQLLALRCGTACHWRLHQHCLWRPSTLNSTFLFTELYADIRLI